MTQVLRRNVKGISSWPDFVADLLAYQGWDNTALARRAGVDRSMPGRWMSGETQPTIESIRAVCQAVEVDIREGLIAAGLFTEDELSYELHGQPDMSKVPDELLLAEMRKRMRRHLHPEVQMHVTAQQDDPTSYVVAEEPAIARPPHSPTSCG